ncbi:MAG: Ribosomal RNA large subunit methyltransferase I [Chloroflexi bacterium ADurb.Bin325]|nr:MAG: Ribosomal RNA large subunit methyltransferase I [Chloroflexi bacterium ADurb.Bin325]
MTATLYLRPGKEKPVRQRHPWVFSGAIGRTTGDPAAGDIVDVADADGAWLARGYFNPRSQIVVRLLTWDRHEAVDADFWRRRLAAAGAGRAELRLEPQTTAYRLAYAESDGVAGLVVDRYGDWLVVQFLTLGVDARRAEILAALQAEFRPAGIVERSDAAVRRQEGLPLRSGLAAGRAPDARFEIREHGLRFPVDLLGGQKTGFYVDQRENRRIVAAHAAGKRVLNAFSFTGAFGVYALAAGAAHVTNVDSSYDALAGAEAALRLNGFDPDAQAEGIAGDVFQVLRALRDEGRQFDLVILDPPKFARNKAELEAATRGYKDINLLGLKLLARADAAGAAPLLATFSCSGLVTADLFQKIVFGASADAGRDAQIIARLHQGPDHPVLLSFPEGEYLKGLLARAV